MRQRFYTSCSVMPLSNADRSKKKSRKPAHQNTFAFQHNPKSKKTEKILNSPIEGACRRCYDKIEWRKKYRKYKPLTQPGKCNICKQQNVKAAYHTICTKCTTSEKALKSLSNDPSGTTSSLNQTNEIDNDMTVSNEEHANTVENHNMAEGTKREVLMSKRIKIPTVACAICVKAPALPNQEDETKAVEERIEQLVQETGRMTLRERKALERKLWKEHEDKKQFEKEARRELRDKAEKESCNAKSEEDILMEADQDAEAMKREEDPFYQAVGGADKLLTGEAYQKMRLEKEQH